MKVTRSMLSFVVIVGGLFLPLATLAATEEKFHLVYLVSTDKVEVGTKVYVEPLFLSDGKNIKSLFEYCRAKYRKNENEVIKVNQIAGDITVIDSYCSNSSFQLPDKKYSTLNNSGVSIRIGIVDFQTNQLDSQDVIPPVMPNAGTALIKDVSSETTVRVSKSESSGPQYFFLMSSNPSLLKNLVPTVEMPVDTSLLKKASSYAKEVKGKIRNWHNEWATKKGPVLTKFEERTSPSFENALTEIVAPIVADVDHDSNHDLIVGMRAGPVDIDKSSESTSEFQWAAIGFILHSGKSSFIGDVSQKALYRKALATGYARHVPTVLVKTKDCQYVISFTDDMFLSFSLISVPGENEICRHQRLEKLRLKM